MKEKISQRIKNADSRTIKRLVLRAKEIEKRGLDDENILLQLIEDEFNNNYKTPGILGAGMYDKMNYMCRFYMDRTVRLALYYDYVIDADTLRKVLVCLFEKAPIFHSKFFDNHVVPYWIVTDYHIDDAFKIIETDDLEKTVKELALPSIDGKDNIQLKVFLLVNGDKCALFFRWNHMVFDGGGFRQLIKDITDNYRRFRNGETDKLTFRTGTRRYDRVYKDMPNGKEAKKKYNKVFAKDDHKLPYSEKSNSDSVFICKRTLPAEILKKMLIVGKECDGTFNDVFVSAYLRAAYRLMQCDKNDSLSISCAMDLRRYINDVDSIGYTNHTNFMPCTVSKMGDSIRETITELAQNTRAVKADEFNGLHGLPLLNVAYWTMIYLQAELVVKANYYNANFAVSNVGRFGGESFSFDGHDIVDAFIGGSAKYKPTTAVLVYTVGDKLTYTLPLIGNAEDEALVEKLFDLIEEELRSL